MSGGFIFNGRVAFHGDGSVVDGARAGSGEASEPQRPDMLAGAGPATLSSSLRAARGHAVGVSVTQPVSSSPLRSPPSPVAIRDGVDSGLPLRRNRGTDDVGAGAEITAGAGFRASRALSRERQSGSRGSSRGNKPSRGLPRSKKSKGKKPPVGMGDDESRFWHGVDSLLTRPTPS